ncbi:MULTISPECIES: ExeA family protein [Crateriforma]|uniref:AAA+ ATPase domain-containing protein n=1 Tax=Crateriforma conspicua TaxID=2527996 RepID=A0A5C6FQ59_9PLAN|nr:MULTISPECIES: AAA family ATPase [Crateriforma]TWU65267.1 hypothetical protein V7x_08130 [Crateriforma conspicua]
MYESFFKLTGRPFENFGDDSYYPSESHQTAMLKMRYAIENRRSAIAVCGDSGIGKSMLIRLLAAQLPEAIAPLVTVVFPKLPGDQLLGYVTDKITRQCGPPDEPDRLTLHRLESFLDENVAADRHALVVVDEAHLLDSHEQLETLRLLLNLATGGGHAESALTLLLVGQSILLTQIEQNASLDERVSEKCLLRRFTPDQTASYVQHRLQQVGRQMPDVFTTAAVDRLHSRSLGIPRRINRLADLALMVAYADDAARVTEDHIEGVHRELATTP